jgi:transposase-like protein
MGRETFRMRNRIERWFGILKAKLRCLPGGFPHNSTLNTITRYIGSFTTIYNWLPTHNLS